MTRNRSFYFWAFGINVISVAFSFLSQTIISRYFGVSALGVFALYANYAAILSRFLNYGGQNYLVKTLPGLRRESQGNCDSQFIGVNLLSLALAMLIMISLALLVVVEFSVSGTLTIFGRDAKFYFLCVATAFCLSLLSNMSSYFRSAGAKLSGFVFDRAIYQPLFFGTLVLTALAPIKLSPHLVWSFYVICASLAGTVYFFRESPHFSSFRLGCIAVCLRLVSFRNLTEFFLTAVLLVVYGRSLVPLADRFLMPIELGQFSAALVLASPIMFGNALLNMIFGPSISIAIASGNSGPARFIALRNTGVCSVISLLMAACIYLGSDIILSFMQVAPSFEMTSAIFWALADAVVSSVAASWLFGSQFLHSQRSVNLSWIVLILFKVGFVALVLSEKVGVADVVRASFVGNLSALSLVAIFYVSLRFGCFGAGQEKGVCHE